MNPTVGCSSSLVPVSLWLKVTSVGQYFFLIRCPVLWYFQFYNLMNSVSTPLKCLVILIVWSPWLNWQGHISVYKTKYILLAQSIALPYATWGRLASLQACRPFLLHCQASTTILPCYSRFTLSCESQSAEHMMNCPYKKHHHLSILLFPQLTGYIFCILCGVWW